MVSQIFQEMVMIKAIVDRKYVSQQRFRVSVGSPRKSRIPARKYDSIKSRRKTGTKRNHNIFRVGGTVQIAVDNVVGVRNVDVSCDDVVLIDQEVECIEWVSNQLIVTLTDKTTVALNSSTREIVENFVRKVRV